MTTNTETIPQEKLKDLPCAGDPENGEHEWKFQDDSFDHEFGTERVWYFACKNCDATRPMEDGDYGEDYEY